MFDTSQERLKLASGALLAVELFVGSGASAVAVLGLVAVVLVHKELLQLFLGFLAVSVGVDIVWLLAVHHSFWIWLATLLLLGIKGGAAYFAWDLFSSLNGGSAPGGEYAPFGTGAARDPFSSRFGQPQSASGYAPPGPAPVQPPAQPVAPVAGTPLPQTLPPTAQPQGETLL